MQSSNKISLKPSKYNIFYENQGAVILYNTASGAIIKLTNEHADKVKNILNSSDIGLNAKDPVLNTLIENKFVVNSDLNEIDLVKTRVNKSRNQVDKLIFTIVPTLACNFKCPYCFETNTSSNVSMSENDCLSTLKFIKQQVKLFAPPVVTLVWFGGEPLLSIDMIKSMSASIRDICKEHSAKLAANVITNGYLLDQDMALALKECEVKSVQITLDGMEKMHNSRRIHKSGQPTFGEIQKSIIISKNHFDHVNVRFNVDKANFEDLMKLLDEPWLYGNNVQVSPGHLENFNNSCAGKKDIEVLNLMEYYPIARSLNQKYHKNNGKGNFTAKELIDTLPVKSSYCGASNIGQWIIGPGAMVYKCLSCLGDKDSCGYLYDGLLMPNSKLTKWMLDEAVSNQLCAECNLFPLCLGGCPKAKELYPDPEEGGLCSFWRQYTYDTLNDIAKQLKG